ncbi:hypothetical protein BV22DRAFT_1097836 [Leucogyrophana mollusca]|uniref:Uncharacterized protein n=1 Tax=Leucogyrophana mollusca TaxID=85980 RepID=A0ACB8B611_9AGAM|nr:hypothetical protein BV22DRAFT_1097836 [Leucogyrophana mollusca]
MFSAMSKRTAKTTSKDTELERRRAHIERLERETFGEPSKATGPETLGENELWWHNHYQFFKDHGYLLRPRYAPGWIPSWKTSKKECNACEDAEVPLFGHILDATRTEDGSFVTLKIVKKSVHPHEVDIGLYFSSKSLASDPANHCVPIHEVLQVPEDDDRVIIVMPLLRLYSNPRFDTVGEVVECFRQLFEGLHFMHTHHVAHRDCMNLNTMMDAKSLYIDAYHPSRPRLKRDFSGFARHYTRTQRPPKYFFIDFGISRRYDPSNSSPLEDPIWGGDKTVPEFQKSNEPRNPFPTDVYYLGNLIREDILQTKVGFEFMEPLITDMVRDDPNKRPTMDEVVSRFDEIRKGLGNWKLRSRVVDKEEGAVSGLFRGAGHWARRVKFIAGGVPAIPARS